jgi:hypothetical protein
MDLKKIFDKISKQNSLLELDLKNKTVLTEAATGPYFVTPFIAAMAGAEVVAFVKDSKYGKADDVIRMNENIRDKYFKNLRLVFTDKIEEKVFRESDVITNSGHLRPLDKRMLSKVKADCVIPLMYEAWEYRETDIDLEYCIERNIKVGATNERHSGVEVFKYLGDMAIKLILDSGLSLYRNKFVLICNNDFGPFIANTLSKVCENIGVIDVHERKDLYIKIKEVDFIGDFPKIIIPDKYRDADGIIFTAYPFDKSWIGSEDSDISVDKLLKEFNDPFLLRFAGDVDTRSLTSAGIKFYPEEVKSGHMGILPSDIGFDPVVKLQSGGLKAAQLMMERKTDYRNESLVELMS